MKPQPCLPALLLCLPLLLAAAAPAATQSLTDLRQQTQIWTAYATQEHLRGLGISVDVRNGRATLTGTVESQVEKDLAEQIAHGVDGITAVDNQLRVDPDLVLHRHSGPRDFGTVVADATLTARVKSKLLWNSTTDALDIDVDTRDGRVTLKGAADSTAARELAGRIALDTPGVTGIDNQVQLRPAQARRAPSPAQQKLGDAWISAKVRTSLRFSRNLEGRDIQVETRDGRVRLSGQLESPQQREHALEIARGIRGVREVDGSALQAPALVPASPPPGAAP